MGNAKRRNGSDSGTNGGKKRRPLRGPEKLEDRILLSATWADAEGAEEVSEPTDAGDAGSLHSDVLGDGDAGGDLFGDDPADDLFHSEDGGEVVAGEPVTCGFEDLSPGASPSTIDFGNGVTAEVSQTDVRTSTIIEGSDGHGASATEGSKFWKLTGGETTLEFSEPVSKIEFAYTDFDGWTDIEIRAGDQTFTLDADAGSAKDGRVVIEAPAGESFDSVSFEWMSDANDGLGIDEMTLTPGVAEAEPPAAEFDGEPVEYGFEDVTPGDNPTSLSLGDGLSATVSQSGVAESEVLEHSDGYGAYATEGTNFWKIRGGETTLEFNEPVTRVELSYTDFDQWTDIEFRAGDRVVTLDDAGSARDGVIVLESPDGEPFDSISIEWVDGNSDGLGIDGLIVTPAGAEIEPLTLEIADASVAENAPAGTVVATASASSGAGSVTYSLTDDAGGRFVIDAETGEITVAEGANLDHESAAEFTVTVAATDASAGSVIASEDFESGAEGWTDGTGDPYTTTTDLNDGDTLLRIGGTDGAEGVTKSFATDPSADFTVVEVDLVKLDSWDEGWRNENETFTVFVDGEPAFTFQPQGATNNGNGQDSGSGENGSISWTVESSGSDTNLNGGGHADRVYSVRMVIEGQRDSVDLGFGTSLSESIRNESLGINNVTIVSSNSADATADGIESEPTEPNTVEQTIAIAVTDVNEAPTGLTLNGAEPANEITVTLGGESYRGDPRYEIVVDGEVVATGEVDWSGGERFGDQENPWRDVTVSIPGDAAPESVEVRFPNDKSGGDSSTDRNLYVDKIEVNGATFQAEGEGVEYDRASKSDIDGQEGMFWKGSLEFDTSSAPDPISAEVPENAGGAVVGQLAVNDPDAGDTIDFAVSDDRFEVVDNELRVREGVELDHETEPRVTVTVTATDSAGHELASDFTIAVSDVNEAPTVTDPGSFTVPEGGAVTLGVSASDAEGDTLTYTWRQTGGPAAEIDDPSSPTPELAAPRVGEDTTLTFEVTVSDGEHESVQTVSVSVEAGAELAVDAGDDLTVNEGERVTLSVNTTTLGNTEAPPAIDFDAVDIDSHGGASQDRALEVTTNGDEIRLEGNGWKSVEMPTSVTVDTVLEFQFRADETGEIHGIGFDNDGSLSENRSFRLHGTQNWGTPIEPVEGDPADGWATYRIPVGEHFTGDFDRLVLINDHDVSNPDATSAFRGVRVIDAGDIAPPVDAPEVELRWEQIGGPAVDLDDPTAASPAFDAPAVGEPTEITFRVTAFDGEDTRVDEVTVHVQPVNEAPIAVEFAGGVLPEGAAPGTVVATASATDADPGDTHTFALADDADGRFVIDADTGEIRVAEGAGFDHETEPSVRVAVTATDAGGLETTSELVIDVADANEAIESVSFTPESSLSETAEPGTVVGSIAATDPDAGETFTYDVNDDRFDVDHNGVVTVAEGATFDFETEPSVTMTATVTDSAGHVETVEFTIDVVDVDEPAPPVAPTPEAETPETPTPEAETPESPEPEVIPPEAPAPETEPEPEAAPPAPESEAEDETPEAEVPETASPETASPEPETPDVETPAAETPDVATPVGDAEVSPAPAPTPIPEPAPEPVPAPPSVETPAPTPVENDGARPEVVPEAAPEPEPVNADAPPKPTPTPPAASEPAASDNGVDPDVLAAYDALNRASNAGDEAAGIIGGASETTLEGIELSDDDELRILDARADAEDIVDFTDRATLDADAGTPVTDTALNAPSLSDSPIAGMTPIRETGPDRFEPITASPSRIVRATDAASIERAPIPGSVSSPSAEPGEPDPEPAGAKPGITAMLWHLLRGIATKQDDTTRKER